MNTEAPQGRFLRHSLRANAAFSLVSGLTFTIGATPIAGFLGVAPAALVTSVGLNLLGFAVALVWLASREHIRPAIDDACALLRVTRSRRHARQSNNVARAARSGECGVQCDRVAADTDHGLQVRRRRCARFMPAVLSE